MPKGTCYYCERLATAQCPTCGRLFCVEHGEDVCLRCLAPESAMPSIWAFRGSLLALLAGTAVTVYLVVSPPTTKSSADVVRAATSTVPAGPPTATPTPRGTGATPTAVRTPASAPTPSPTQEGTSRPTETPTAERTYTVKPGDTLSAIAAEFGTTVDEILALNPGVNPTTLGVGAVLKIPPAR